jgi:energy-coupling factor transporter transmembrane protein EcfT
MKKPNLYNRIVRTILLILVILLIAKIPKQSLFLVLRIAVPGIIIGSILLGLHRFTRKLRANNKKLMK